MVFYENNTTTGKSVDLIENLMTSKLKPHFKVRLYKSQSNLEEAYYTSLFGTFVSS